MFSVCYSLGAGFLDGKELPHGEHFEARPFLFVKHTTPHVWSIPIKTGAKRKTIPNIQPF
jgi:hypothetical protein